VNIGRAYAIVRGRMGGNREKAQGLLNRTKPAKRMEMNRQDAAARGIRKKPYRLGEKPRRRS
jgi:hypothetical protein